jgi:hypothetical protein
LNNLAFIDLVDYTVLIIQLLIILFINIYLKTMEGAPITVATSEINLAEFPAIAAEIKERQDLVKAAPKD